MQITEIISEAKKDNVVSLNTKRWEKDGIDSFHDDAKWVIDRMGVNDPRFTKNIGNRGKFKNPKFPADEGEFTIVGVQKMWGHDQDGNYVPNRIGYRVIMDTDIRRFGKPALPEKIIIFE